MIGAIGRPVQSRCCQLCVDVIDANVRAVLIVGQFPELFRRVERDIQHWVKAAVESSMGSLGTVGALAVEEFLSKLKEAVQELSRAPVMPDGGDTFPLPPSVSGSVAGVDCRRAALGSDVPSEFGEKSVVPSGGTSSAISSTSKPSKNFKKIM